MTEKQVSPRRYGLYYSPEAGPYRQADLEAYLPILQSIGAGWLVLRSTANRAVPEDFITGLLEADIQPFIHLAPALDVPLEEVQPLLRAYARWGVRHVALFDRPNRRAVWGRAWASPDLPARFLDAFQPLAEAALAEGLTPFFPPLEPGGDYWDLAFLRAALEGLQRRAPDVAERLALSALAWSEGKPLDWGAGGPEIWPQAQPYYTPAESQDHRGFRIFDWYAAEARAALGRVPDLFLVGMGSRYGREPEDEVTAKNQAIATRFWENALPEHVAGGAFWVLTAPADHPEAAAAWMSPTGKPRPIIAALRPESPSAHGLPSDFAAPGHTYLLLPPFEQGVPPHYLSAALPWLQSGRATVGFQIGEALHADQIIVLGQTTDYPPQTLATLRTANKPVHWLSVTGTEVASPQPTH